MDLIGRYSERDRSPSFTYILTPGDRSSPPEFGFRDTARSARRALADFDRNPISRLISPWDLGRYDCLVYGPSAITLFVAGSTIWYVVSPFFTSTSSVSSS